MSEPTHAIWREHLHGEWPGVVAKVTALSVAYKAVASAFSLLKDTTVIRHIEVTITLRD